MSRQSNVLLVAAQTLRAIIDQGRSLDKALSHEFDRVPAEQRGLLQELTYGGCRHYHFLNGILAVLLQKPVRNKDRMVHFLLLVGLYQLEFMRLPDHAAVDQTVKALAASKQSWARGLVNGVLRQFLRLRGGGPKADNSGMLKGLTDSQIAGLPGFLYEEIRRAWPEQADAIIRASNQRPPMVLRVNRQKTTRDNYITLLASHELAAEPTVDSADGIALSKPVSVERLPMFDEGWVSVQDTSAQLCTSLMRLAERQRVLDGCAAPGGKACALLEAEPTITLTAVDLPERLDAVRENLERMGLTAILCGGQLQDKDEWWDGRKWPRILLDAPCSGTGVIRRHPDIQHRRLPGDLQRFATQQMDLLKTAWSMLADDGMLLYVTCSIMPVENEQVIAAFLEENQPAETKPPEGIDGITLQHGLQRLPGVHQGDGFYYALLSKPNRSA